MFERRPWDDALLELSKRGCRLIRAVPVQSRRHKQKRAAQIRALPKDLTIDQVAERMDISPPTAAKWCQRTRNRTMHPKSQARVLKIAELRSLPPGLTLKTIAERLSVPYSTAHHLVHLTHYQFCRAYHKVSRDQWQNVDWSKPDSEIATELGISRQLVYEKRKSFGKKPPVRRRQFDMAEIHARLRRRIADLPAGLSIPEVAALLHVCRATAARYGRQFGYMPRPKQAELFAMR